MSTLRGFETKAMPNVQCKQCGCVCKQCTMKDQDVHLHVEIENLKQRLAERDNHIVTMETNFLNEANKFPNGELVAMQEELITWQDKYKRLYEAHRRVQRVNQGLEDKLLRLVDVSETDKNTLTKDVATLSHKLAEANYTIKKLTEDNERYKNDVSLAIQFLQCKPGNFVSQKFDSLPNEVQAKVSTYMASKRKPEERKSPPEIKSIKVPIPTFPPTAMVYSVPKSPNADQHREEKEPESPPVDIVSAAIMAKVLEERERERSCMKHCDTCTCSKNIKIIHHTTTHTVSTQTGDYDNALCLSCNSNLENRPSLVKVVKNVDSNIKNKSIPVYIHDYKDNNINQNVAKVQPNNFLIDTKCKVENTVTVKPILLPPADENLNRVATVKPDILTSAIVDRPSSVKSDKYPVTTASSKSSEPVISSAKGIDSSDIFKGGRHCSMRLQTGSNNILLDNTRNDSVPVLYTREKKPKNEGSSRITKSESTTSEDSKTVSSMRNSANNRRVADWIESNMNTGDTSDCSESLNSQKTDEKSDEKSELNKEKYKEMEDNVKRFLFGEFNFLRTVEIGRHKYDGAQSVSIQNGNQ